MPINPNMVTTYQVGDGGFFLTDGVARKGCWGRAPFFLRVFDSGMGERVAAGVSVLS